MTSKDILQTADEASCERKGGVFLEHVRSTFLLEALHVYSRYSRINVIVRDGYGVKGKQ